MKIRQFLLAVTGLTWQRFAGVYFLSKVLFAHCETQDYFFEVVVKTVLRLLLCSGVVAALGLFKPSPSLAASQAPSLELKLIKRDAPSRSADELDKNIIALNGYIGSYPPRFANEAERQQIYQRWLDLLADAEANLLQSQNREQSLYLLSELYRQGHNMDVKGSAQKAQENIDSCLNAFPDSVACHFSASYFFLSVGPNFIDRAEKSLLTLKQHFSPEFNEEVESGYVFVYLYRRDAAMAKKHINFYLEKFPNSSRVSMFTKIRDSLGNGIEVKSQP